MMRQNKQRTLLIFFLFVFVTPAFFIGCQSGKKKADPDLKIEDFITDDDIFNDIDQAKKIFYSLPTPLETAMLIKSAGAEYDQELLNSLDNVTNYTSNRDMALNLGIYTTDLSFASLFDQTQTSIDYMQATRSMAEGLDVVDAIDNETIKRLEANLNNRDVVMDIISETFLNSSSYLKENERQDVAAIVLVGGWVEGLYLATVLVGDGSIDDNKLVDRILEQKLSFNIVQRLLEDNKSSDSGAPNQDVVDIINELQPLKDSFNKVSVTTTETVVEAGTENNVNTLKSKTTVTITPEDFKQLQATVYKLRSSFIQ